MACRGQRAGKTPGSRMTMTIEGCSQWERNVRDFHIDPLSFSMLLLLSDHNEISEITNANLFSNYTENSIECDPHLWRQFLSDVHHLGEPWRRPSWIIVQLGTFMINGDDRCFSLVLQAKVRRPLFSISHLGSWMCVLGIRSFVFEKKFGAHCLKGSCWNKNYI